MEPPDDLVTNKLSLSQQLYMDKMLYGFAATKIDAQTGEEFRVHPLDIAATYADDAMSELCDLCIREHPCECGPDQCFCSCGDCLR